MNIDKCNNLIILYKSLLKKRDFLFCNIDSKNIKDIKNICSEIRDIIKNIEKIVDKYRKDKIYWSEFYRNEIGSFSDFSDVEVPEKPKEGNWRLMFIDNSLDLATVFERIKFNNNYDINLSKVIDLEYRSRPGKSNYAIWVEDISNSVINTKNNKILDSLGFDFIRYGIFPENIKIKTMTLKERILLELMNYYKGFDYLDKSSDMSNTLCSGSCVEHALIGERGIMVAFDTKRNNLTILPCSISDSNKELRARLVVSLE